MLPSRKQLIRRRFLKDTPATVRDTAAVDALKRAVADENRTGAHSTSAKRRRRVCRDEVTSAAKFSGLLRDRCPRRPIMFPARTLLATSLALNLGVAFASAGDIGSAAPTQPWPQALCLGNDGYWRGRLRVVVRNDSGRPLAGNPVEVAIGRTVGQADLEGVSADALRLLNNTGAELLWSIAAPGGRPVGRGPIPPGSVLTLPAECPTHGQASYWLYFDNPLAWAVPDFLNSQAGRPNEAAEKPVGVSIDVKPTASGRATRRASERSGVYGTARRV